MTSSSAIASRRIRVSRRLAFGSTAALVAASSVFAPPVAEVAHAAPPEHRVTLFSDSVGLGAAAALPRAFPADWQVNTIGTPAYMVEQLRDRHVIPTLISDRSIIGDHVVIASGYNYPHWDPARFDRSIDSMIATLTDAGVEHIYWVTLREVKQQFVSASAWREGLKYLWYFPTVNEHLERAVQRHPNLTLIDWAAVADQVGLTYDAIHLNPTGAALYSTLIADAVHNSETLLDNATVTRVHVADASTSAVAVNLTATGTRAPGWFAAYPCEAGRPDVSNLNHGRDHTVAAGAIIPVGPSGDICVYNEKSTQLIVDLFGRFDETVDLVNATPTRLHDSRIVGARQPELAELELHVADPGVGSVALNVTALESDAPGFVTVQPCGLTTLETSNVNVVPGSVTPNLVMTQPDADGNVCIIASTTTHLIVDRFASFATGAPIDLVRPDRVTDTRSDGSTRTPGRVVRFSVSSTELDTTAPIGGVFMNLTIVGAHNAGFGTVYPCAGGRADTSNINYRRGQTIANFAVVQPDANGEICVYSSEAADILIDVMGSAGPGFEGMRPSRKVDTRSGIGTN